MTEKQITLKEALELVDFELMYGEWKVVNVKCDVLCDIQGEVRGSVIGSVGGRVWSTISGRKWMFVETPKEKLKRLIEEGADKAQLLEAFNQLEEFDG